MATAPAADLILSNLDGLLPDLEALYKDVHAHPELSMQETRTAALAATAAAGGRATRSRRGVGKTGVVGLLRNGEGPTVMLRADMDALPDRGSDRPALCEQGQGDRSRREDGAGRAHVRPRHARGLARRRDRRCSRRRATPGAER